MPVDPEVRRVLLRAAELCERTGHGPHACIASVCHDIRNAASAAFEATWRDTVPMMDDHAALRRAAGGE